MQEATELMALARGFRIGVYGFDEAVLDLPGHAIGAPLAADEEAKQ